MNMLRGQKEYEGNPVGLSPEVCETMRAELDRHLAAYWIMYAQYHKHHWLVEGPQFRDVHLFLEENYDQVHEHLDQIAERITLLGYSPTTRLENYVELAYIEEEPEGIFRIRDSFEHDMKNEQKIATELRKSIKRAFELGDYGSKSMLEELLAEAEDRAHHLEHFLGGDSLSIGMLHKASDLTIKQN